MKLRYEPAMIGGGAMGAVMALLVYYKVLDYEAAGLWAVAIGAAAPVVQAAATRIFVMATAKIRDSGHDPERIDTQARINTEQLP